MTSRLHLNDDVYFCVTQGQGVFLDLAQDAYSAVPVRPGLIDGDAAVTETQLMVAFESHKADLLAEGLFASQGSPARSLLSYQSIPRPRSHIFHLDDDRAFGLAGAAGGAVQIGWVDMVDFYFAARRASRQLKTRHIREVVRAVRARKAASAVRSGDLGGLMRETAIFRKMRPWYARSFLCLFDALALVEFLAHRGHFPDWVFGVQAQPFGAHCWLQTDEYLLNEGTEYAGQFTPIMSV